MKKLIAVLAGGISGERKISLITAKACAIALKQKGYKVKVIDVRGYFLEDIRKIKPAVIFNALHGRYGEDGFTQSILEYIGIPYTHSGVLSSSLAMDKELSRLIFKKKGIKVPKYFILNQEKNLRLKKNMKEKNISFPIVIKPINEGSSLGVFICKNYKEFLKNYKKLTDYKKIIVEEFIPGKEIQAAVMGNKPLGAIELQPKRKFYDYNAKYKKNSGTKHLMPARLSKIKYDEVLSLAKKAHKYLGCRGITRSDFKFYNDKFYLLELNTQPGMTSLSLVPEIAEHTGIKFPDLVEWMIKDASCKR